MRHHRPGSKQQSIIFSKCQWKYPNRLHHLQMAFEKRKLFVMMNQSSKTHQKRVLRTEDGCRTHNCRIRKRLHNNIFSEGLKSSLNQRRNIISQSPSIWTEQTLNVHLQQLMKNEWDARLQLHGHTKGRSDAKKRISKTEHLGDDTGSLVVYVIKREIDRLTTSAKQIHNDIWTVNLTFSISSAHISIGNNRTARVIELRSRMSNSMGSTWPKSPISLRWRTSKPSPRKGAITCDPIRAEQIQIKWYLNACQHADRTYCTRSAKRNQKLQRQWQKFR